MHFDERKIKQIQSKFEPEFIELLYKYAQSAPKNPATVGKIVNGVYTTDYDKWCTANFINYDQFKDQVNLIKNQCIAIVEKNFNVSCLDTEIHFLHYITGSEYKSHIDGQYVENDVARRGVDRDITCVLYLNDDYEGGELYFDFFKSHIKPNKGDLLIYPTTWQYTHGVKPVIGNRYAIVFWFKTTPELNVSYKIKDASIIKFLQSITNPI